MENIVYFKKCINPIYIVFVCIYIGIVCRGVSHLCDIYTNTICPYVISEL